VFDRIANFEGTGGCADIMITITKNPGRDAAEVIAELASSIRPPSQFDAENCQEFVRLFRLLCLGGVRKDAAYVQDALERAEFEDRWR
jgi:hypothetical protein